MVQQSVGSHPLAKNSNLPMVINAAKDPHLGKLAKKGIRRTFLLPYV